MDDTTQFARVRGQKFVVPHNMTKKKLVNILNNYHSGVICICHVCHKVDINPYEHYSVCNPSEEMERRTTIDRYMGW